jgi:hypothetical protein
VDGRRLTLARDMAVNVSDLLAELEQFFSPLRGAFSSAAGLEQFLRELGYDVSAVNLGAAAGTLAPRAADIAELESLVEAAQGGGGLSPENVARLGELGDSLFRALRDLPASVAAVAPDVFAQVFDYLLADYLHFRFPAAFRFLQLVGVIEIEHLVPGRDPDARQIAYDRVQFQWERIPRWVSDPAAVMREVYGWSTVAFSAGTLLRNLALFCQSLDLPVMPIELPSAVETRFVPPTLPEPDRIGVRFPVYAREAAGVYGEAGVLALPVKGTSASDLGLGVMPYVLGTVAGSLALNEDGSATLTVTADASVAGGVVFELHPSGLSYQSGVLDSTAGDASFKAEVRKVPSGGAPSILIFGEADGTRLECKALLATIGGDPHDFFLAAGVQGLRLVIDVSEDGLLGHLITAPVEIDAGDLVGGWRLGRGIYFEQGAGLRIRVPLSIDLQGLRVHEIGVELQFAPAFTTIFTVNADATIGPLFLGVEGLGLRLSVVRNDNGQFGRFDLVPGLQFPTGYVAALSAGPISGGGGLLVYDHEYRGALALKFQSFSLAAFAILTTRLPNGQDGFSFLASLFGEFEIQLGYGFKLTGLGGIIGVHRTANVEALRETLYAGRLDSILFPASPIQDASVILNDMAAIFPARQDTHLFGPMAKIAWGTPTLIEGKIGVVLELGRELRLLLLGNLTAALPVRDAAVVVLNLDFIGTIDFSTGAVAFDATLSNSRILSWPISGEAAVRTGWGASAGLVASIGGLHPQFPIPAGFPNLHRVTIAFGTNNPSITLTAYVAVTLNSVQAGASATLYVKGPHITFVGTLSVEGWVSFDAIVNFDPFQFDARLSLGLRLLVDGDTVCGIGGDLRLQGPNPYKIRGKVWASVCGVDVSVPVSHTWGDPVTELLQTADPLERLVAALATSAAFEPVEVSSRVSGVTMRSAVPEDTPLDPSGGLRYLQRALPLRVALQRIGTARVVGAFDTFDLVFRDAQNQVLPDPRAELDFVRGEFFELSEDDRLRGPATARFAAGLDLESGDEYAVDFSPQRFDLEYETIFLGDAEDETRHVGASPLAGALAQMFVNLSASTASRPLHPDAVRAGFGAGRITLEPPSFRAVEPRMDPRGPRATALGDVVGLDAVHQATKGARVVPRYLTSDRGRGR